METERWRDKSMLSLLFACAIFLTGRMVYLLLANPVWFPINTVKIVANYEHITRHQLEDVLAVYLNSSYFTVKTAALKQHLLDFDWCDKVIVERTWPDTLKITVVERVPRALWNGKAMTKDGKIFEISQPTSDLNLPQLSGPTNQQLHVLQIYEKLSKLLGEYGLQAATLQMRDNQAWEMMLTNGVMLRLGKRDFEQRLRRFCQVYRLEFADKQDKLSSVDLRYARGMAVQWKEQTRR